MIRHNWRDIAIQLALWLKFHCYNSVCDTCVFKTICEKHNPRNTTMSWKSWIEAAKHETNKDNEDV